MKHIISAFTTAWSSRFADLPVFPARSILPADDGDVAELAELADRVFAAKPLHRQLIRADVWADTVEATGINPGMVLWPNPAADLLARWQR